MKKLDIVLSTNNKHKVQEFKEIFKPYKNVNIYSLSDLGIDVNPVEDGLTFKDNSLIKASAVAKLTDKIVIADDSGLEIDALDGFPGVNSSRFMENEPYVNKFKVIFKMLENKNRSAQFHCIITLLNLEKDPLFFEGIVRGKISQTVNGDSGFGYDPIFIPDGYEKSFAQLGNDIKNNLSHRAIASKKLISFLKEHNYIN